MIAKFFHAIVRTRNLYQGVGSILVLLMLFAVDPDAGFIQDLEWGAQTVASLLLILKSIFGVILLHWSRKAFFDYIDLKDVYEKTMADQTGSTGAGLYMVGIGLFSIACAMIIQKAF